MNSAEVIVPYLEAKDANVTCPSGKVVGGGHVQTGPVTANLLGSKPISSNTWQASVYNPALADATVTAYAICMTTDPGTIIATASKGKVAKKHK